MGAVPKNHLPCVRVNVIFRLPPFDLGDGSVNDPEPPPGTLVPGAEPDLAGHPGRERKNPDFPEIFRKQVFIEIVRADRAPLHPPRVILYRISG